MVNITGNCVVDAMIMESDEVATKIINAYKMAIDANYPNLDFLDYITPDDLGIDDSCITDSMWNIISAEVMRYAESFR